MVSAREILNKELEFEGLTYRCNAHILFLLAKDLVKTDVIKHITIILKYFQKHTIMHYGSAQILLLEVHWNTYCNSLEFCFKNLLILTKDCEVHRSQIVFPTTKKKGGTLNHKIEHCKRTKGATFSEKEHFSFTMKQLDLF